MNILLVNHYAGSWRHGMEFRPYLFAKEWVKAGHAVRIVAASFSHLRHQQPYTEGPVTWERFDGIDYCWIATPAYTGNGIKRVVNIFAFLLRCIRYRKQLVVGFPPDLVIASSTYPLDNILVHAIARKFDAQHVYEVHDLWPLSLIELGGMSRWHPFILLMKWAELYAYRSADTVVSLLPYAEGYMRASGLAEHKFTYIPNGIEISEDRQCAAGLPELHDHTLHALREKYQCIVCYTGGHAVSNALESFVKAAAFTDAATVAFVLVGNGVEKRRLETMARDLHYTNVYFLPPVPRDVVSVLLAQMDILFIGWQDKPIYRYGVGPNKLLDYMLAGKPIIHANAAGNDVVAESGCGISIPPENSLVIANAIRHVMQLPESAKRAMGANGRRYVEQNFRNSDLAERFLVQTCTGKFKGWKPNSETPWGGINSHSIDGYSMGNQLP